MEKAEKTNVMRLLDGRKIAYQAYEFEATGETTGVDVARLIGKDVSCVFKTLVTRGKTGAIYVFVIPVAKELDLKKASQAVGEKSIAMLKSSELLPLTGYIHGGCSPIGMKKQYTTTLDDSAKAQERIVFSAGRIGRQVELTPTELEKMVRLRYAALTE